MDKQKDFATQQAINAAAAGRAQITPDMLRSSPNIVCECGGMIFAEKLFFKKISAILSPSGKEEVAPMPIIVCEKCGKVPSAFDTQNILPKEVRADGKVPSTTITLDGENLVKVLGNLEVDGFVYAEDHRVGTQEEWESESGPYNESHKKYLKERE